MNNNKNNEFELVGTESVNCTPSEYMEPNMEELKSRVTTLSDYAILVLSNYHTFHNDLTWSAYGEVEELNLELGHLVKMLNTIVKKLQRGDQG